MAEEEFIQILLRASLFPRNLQDGWLTGLMLSKLIPKSGKQELNPIKAEENCDIILEDSTNHHLEELTTFWMIGV